MVAFLIKKEAQQYLYFYSRKIINSLIRFSILKIDLLHSESK
jgi:hypothetical protein